MPVANSVPIRLQLGLESNPPVFPFDLNTGLAPQFWRGETVEFQIGIFDRTGAAVDLSNLSFLEVDIFPLSKLNLLANTNELYNPFSILPFPTMSPAPLIWETIPAGEITTTILKDAWNNGTAQQAIVEFDWTDTQSLDLGGSQSKQFWLAVTGLTATGKKLVYGGTRIEVYESGAQGIYLPNRIAPLVVPEFTTLYVEPNQQLVFSATIEVSGQVVVEGQLIQV